MAKLITVQFAIHDDDPASTVEGMAVTMQEAFDDMGIQGSFVVTDIAEYTEDPIYFQDTGGIK